MLQKKREDSPCRTGTARKELLDGGLCLLLLRAVVALVLLSVLLL